MVHRAPPTVVFADGDEASGMASMLGGLLEENVRDFPSRRRVAHRVRGEVVFTATDRNLSVTLSFGPGVVQVRDGSVAGAPEVAGPWLTMTKLCSGQLSPLRAWRSDELHLGNPRRAPTAAAASFVLSVPASFYGEVDPTRTRAITTGIALASALGVVLLVVTIRRRRR